MLFWNNLNFLNDQIQEEFQKRWRKATENQRSLKTEEFIGLRKFRSQKSPHAKWGFSY